MVCVSNFLSCLNCVVQEPSLSTIADGVLIASLNYRAPEVLTCVTPFTSKLDMWALGVTLVEVLCLSAFFSVTYLHHVHICR